MANYSVHLKRSAAKEIEDLGTRTLRRRIISKIRRLAADPRPAGCQKLSRDENVYRVRLGDYRIVYRIDDHDKLVVIIKVGHRRDIYR